jgi:hypothetical protein
MKAKIILPGIVLVFTLSPIVVYAASQYNADGFTIFPTKSTDYMNGYRDGLVAASQDVKKLDAGQISGIHADQKDVKCPADSFNADFCAGYKDGYSDEAMDQLE